MSNLIKVAPLITSNVPKRINNFGLLLGLRNTGKSTFLKELIRIYSQVQQTQKILILSAIKQPAYIHIPVIDIDLLSRWKKPSVYQIYGSNTQELLEAIETYFSNGLLILEDSTSFIPKTIPKELRRMIIDTKQKNVDLLTVFHGFMSTPPELFRYADTITMFKTDNPISRKDVIGSYYSDIEKAYYQIQNSKNQYENKTIKIN